jgi:hypothetical protein
VNQDQCSKNYQTTGEFTLLLPLHHMKVHGLITAHQMMSLVVLKLDHALVTITLLVGWKTLIVGILLKHLVNNSVLSKRELQEVKLWNGEI